MRTYKATIRAEMFGDLWMGGRAYKPVTGDGDRFSTDDYTLRDLIEHVCAEEGGDFQSAPKLNGVLILQKISGGRHKITRERRFDLAMFPSIADYLTEETPDYEEDAY